MPAFTGHLRTNEIFAALYNMIISQQVFADNLQKHQTLVDKARVDGGLYGDTKLYVSTDVLKSHPWGNDSEAANLLALDRPPAPATQAIVLDVFRQIRVTVDNYLSKRAWGDEGSFASFTSVTLGWVRETKKVYDGTLYNAFIGTDGSATGNQTVTVNLTSALSGLTGVAKAQMSAMTIARALADLIVDMGDYNRSYNDNQFLRSFADENLIVVWRASVVNEIRKIDLPTIFHKEGLEVKMEENILPDRYFGVVITSSTIGTYSASTPAAGKPINSGTGAYTPGANHANGTLRAMVEKEVTVSSTKYHVFPGDEIPSGATILSSGGNFGYGEVYIVTDDVLCKIYVKLPPFMSAFEVGTSFFNPRSLTETHFLTWGHNTLEHLSNYPAVTVKKA